MWGVERNNLQLIGAQKDLTYLVKQTYVISTLRLSYSVPRHWQQERRVLRKEAEVRGCRAAVEGRG